MKYRILYTLFISMWVSINCFAHAGQTMSLGDCVAEAIENNPSLRAAGHEVAAAGEDIKVFRADFLPSLTTNYTYDRLGSISSKGLVDTDYIDQSAQVFNVRLSQILFAGFRVVKSYENAKSREQVADAKKALEQIELVYHVETTFYKLMKAKQDVIDTSETIVRLDENLKSADRFFKSELIPYADVLQAQVDKSDAIEQRSIAETNVKRETVKLFALMGLPLDMTVAFSEAKYISAQGVPDYDLSLKTALDTRPDIKNLEFQLEIVRNEMDIAMSGYMPVVRFNAGYYDNDKNYNSDLGGANDRDQRNRYWSTGVSASWELFDGGRGWYKKKKYLSEENKLNELLLDAKSVISSGIQNALYSLVNARLRIENAKKTLVAAEEYVSSEESRLRAGVSTLPDLLRAQGRLIRAKGIQARAILDYQLAQAELKLMTGEEYGQGA